MSIKADDRIYETSTTTGTGTYTLAGAATGFQAFSSIGANNYCPYLATDGVNWEVGLGKYTATPDKLERTHVWSSSNGDAAVDWATGTRNLYCVFPAAMMFPGVTARSSNTILGVADHGKTFAVTSTFTQTLTAAATLGDGWYAYYRNGGTGVITIDPDGAETIDGAATLVLGPGAACKITCNGTAFTTSGLGNLVPLASGTASGAAQVDLTAGINGVYDDYVLEIANLTPATDATELWLRVSEDGGSTFKSGASDYAHTRAGSSDGGSFTANSTGDAKIILAISVSNSATRPFRGTVKFSLPAGTAKTKLFDTKFVYHSSTPSQVQVTGMGNYIGTQNAINALRLLMSSGNITLTYALFGVKKG